MANNFQYPNTMNMSQSQMQFQQFFPQPQGNVYIINNSLEVANVPMSAGISVGLCLSENICYLKSMQNGNPTFMAYRLLPYTKEEDKDKKEVDLKEFFEKYEKRLKSVEDCLKKGGRLDELL